ncbi:transmembrane protein, putative [Medicago truncatula]|uniref:Transmembrane protein, putative n=1 Tax=Medicago truncatula TaxID=3880 RepID=G7KVU5_MEDTR|nr:transmembrane protein, putative [Medicago truncatula]
MMLRGGGDFRLRWWWLCVADCGAVLVRFWMGCHGCFGLTFGVGTVCGLELY